MSRKGHKGSIVINRRLWPRNLVRQTLQEIRATPGPVDPASDWHAFLTGLLAKHPLAPAYVGPGILSFVVQERDNRGGLHVSLLRTDGSVALPIWDEILRPRRSKKSMLLPKLFRLAVYPQTQRWRDAFFAANPEPICPGCGEVIVNLPGAVEVDHWPSEHSAVVHRFLREHGPVEITHSDRGVRRLRPEDKAAYQAFHQCVVIDTSSLRLMCTECHRQQSGWGRAA